MTYRLRAAPTEDPHERRTLRKPPPRTSPREPDPRRPGGVEAGALRVRATKGAGRSRHGDRREHALSASPEARVAGPSHERMARGGETKQAVLSPLARRRSDAGSTARGV